MTGQSDFPSNAAGDTDSASPFLFEQYKLAIEMADRMSAKRQTANSFYIGLFSAFGGLYSLHDKASTLTESAWEVILPILAVIWCVVWWFTIQRYRRINIAKWSVIERLEVKLADKPFIWEREELKKKDQPVSPGSFAFTRIEAAIPILVGSIFLLLATRLLLHLLRQH
jgi:hypothetical protein